MFKFRFLHRDTIASQEARSGLFFEPMEPKILLSADALSGLVASDPFTENDSVSLDIQQSANLLLETFSGQETDSDHSTSWDDYSSFLAPAEPAQRHEIVFVDANTPDYEQLLSSLTANNETQYSIVLLQSGSDGIEQISTALENLQGVDAIHIISHGDNGGIQLGNAWLGQDSLADYADQLSAWSGALSDDADLLIYGCNVAGSVSGQQFIQQLAELTGADVAASNDLTGATSLGGDWDLEYQAGEIESALAISLHNQQAWQNVLVVDHVAQESVDETDIVVNQLQNWGQSFTYTSGNGTYNVDQVSVVLAGGGLGLLNPDITVTLEDSWGGTVLGTDTIAFDQTNTAQAWYTFSFGEVTLTDGVEYVIRIDSNLAVLGDVGVGYYDSADNYASGDQLNTFGSAVAGSDLAFKVSISNVEPTGSGSLTATTLNDNAGAVNLFGGLSVSDADGDETDLSLRITLSDDSAGSLSGGGFTDMGGGVYVATGLTVAQANTALDNVTFTPTDNTGSSGSFNTDITVEVNDQGGGGYQSVLSATTVTINRVNDDPTLDQAIPDQNATEDSAFNFAFVSNTFGDVDTGDSLSYTATLADGSALPGWLSFDGSTRTFSGTPLNGDVGAISVKVTADDGNGGTPATDTFDIIIANSNDDPTLDNAIENQNATEDSAFNFTFAANTFGDVDVGDSLTYSATLSDGSALPGWLSFDGSTRTFSGTPLNGDVGTISVKVTADDGNAGTPATDTFDIVIAQVNDAPTLTTTATDPGFTEGNSPVNLFTGTSVDAGEAGQSITGLTLMITNVNDGADETLRLDGSSIALTNANSGTTSTNGLSFSVSVTGTTATLTLTGSLSPAAVETLVDNIQYHNNSSALTLADRAITLAFIQDDGGTANSGVDSSSPDITSVVSLSATNKLWLSTDGNVSSPSDAPGLDAWQDSSVLGFDPASSGFGSTTDGSFNEIFDIESFTGDTNVDAIHYVTTAIDVGTSTPISLLAGDVLLSLDSDETLVSSNTLAVKKEDVFVFRPDTPGDYGSGTFFLLFQNPSGDDVAGVTLVEDATVVGDVVLEKGSFLFTQSGGYDHAIYLFTPGDLSASPTNGTVDLLIDGKEEITSGEDLFHDRPIGIELVENDYTVAGTTLTAGTILLTFDNDSGVWADNTLAGNRQDIYALQLTSTTLVSGATSATVSLFFEGQDVGLDENAESIDGLTFLEFQGGGNTEPTGSVSINGLAQEDEILSADTSTVADADGLGSFTYQWQRDGAVITGATASSYTLGDADVGTQVRVVVSYTDGAGNLEVLFSAETGPIANVNDDPTLDNAITDQNATEDAAFSFTFAANTFGDVDVGDSLTYTATLSGGSALPGWLSFDGSTRTFSGTPLNGDVGTISVKVTADDGNGGTPATDTFDIVIANSNDDPTLDNAIADQNATEDSTFSFTFAANTFGDVDSGDSLTYTATLSDDSALPGWLSFDGSTRTFSGTPLNGDVGTISVKVTADDGNAGTPATDTFDIVIANINDDPTLDNAITDQNATEDTAFSFTFAANTFGDVDSGDSLTYSATLADGSALPGWLSFDGSTRTFSGTPLNGDVGTLSVKVTADDGNGGRPATDTFDIVVANSNDDPSLNQPIPDQNASEDSRFNFTFAANTFGDVDVGDSLTYTATLSDGSALPGWLSFDGSTRTFSGTPLNDDVGAISITVIADDGNGGTPASDTFNIVVENTNDAPVANTLNISLNSDGSGSPVDLDDIVVVDVDQGETLTATLKLSNPGLGQLTANDGATYDAATGIWRISGTVAEVNLALENVTFIPDDSSDLSNIVIEVTIDDGDEDRSGPLVGRIAISGIFPLLEDLPETEDPVDLLETILGKEDPDSPAEDKMTPAASEGYIPLDSQKTPASDVTVSQSSGLNLITDVFQKAETMLQAGYDNDIGESGSGAPVKGFIWLREHMESLRDTFRVLQQPNLLTQLDNLQQQLAEDREGEAKVIAGSVALTAGLSVGYLIWLIRSGFLLTSLLSQLPAWRFIDPLPILGSLRDEDEAEDNESLESIVDEGNQRN